MVEWKKLEDICIRITDGSHFSPQAVEHGYCMPSVKDMTSSGFDYTSCKQISEKDYTTLVKNGCKPQIGDVLVAKDGSMLKYVFPVNKEEDVVVLSSIAILTPKQNILNSSYLSYYLLRSDIKERTIREFSSGGGVPRIILKNFKKIQIPIPSISEQNRIVGILDTFTSSIENLKQQIAERRKQYEHYRDQLLDLEGKEGVEMKTLPEISMNCDRERKPITSSKRVAGIYPYYGASGIVDYVDGYIFDGDYLLISEDGANLVMRSTPIAFSIRGKNWVNNHAHVIKFNDIVTQKYVEIYLNMINLEPWINGAAQPKLNQDNLNKIEIPTPPLSERSRIVSILDTFEASIANLEAQLSQREKQYEYYRNKLLTFD